MFDCFSRNITFMTFSRGRFWYFHASASSSLVTLSFNWYMFIISIHLFGWEFKAGNTVQMISSLNLISHLKYLKTLMHCHMWLEGCPNPYKMEQCWECTFLELFTHMNTKWALKKDFIIGLQNYKLACMANLAIKAGLAMHASW